MNSPEEHSGPVRELLRLPDFLRLWLVGAFANAMRWLELLASGLFAYEVTGSALAVTFGYASLQRAVAEGETRTLSMHHMHTDESITITYKRNGRYDDEALKKLDWFLRDWRRQESTHMDPKLFDIIYSLTRGGPGTETYTTSYYLYYQGFERFHIGQATAGSWLFMLALSFIAYWLIRRLLKPVEA